jgi:hypothetical protein
VQQQARTQSSRGLHGLAVQVQRIEKPVITPSVSADAIRSLRHAASCRLLYATQLQCAVGMRSSSGGGAHMCCEDGSDRPPRRDGCVGQHRRVVRALLHELVELLQQPETGGFIKCNARVARVRMQPRRCGKTRLDRLDPVVPSQCARSWARAHSRARLTHARTHARAQQ